MRRYRVQKTTMGRKYWVRVTEDEIAERRIYWTAVTVIPFVTSMLMFFLWVKGV